MIIIREERPDDVWAREQLLDMTMGPIRFRRSSERLREGRLPARGLALWASATARSWRRCGCGTCAPRRWTAR
jgi:predicted N-acetyltransferase YhbS